MQIHNVVGFTGTRDGMTERQTEAVIRLLTLIRPQGFVHGGAIGADAQFHQLVRSISLGTARITVWPCDIASQQAEGLAGATFMPVMAPLARNEKIVVASTVMIATPKTAKEMVRSGTWATIRYARERRTPLFIVWPDGNISGENFHADIKRHNIRRAQRKSVAKSK